MLNYFDFFASFSFRVLSEGLLGSKGSLYFHSMMCLSGVEPWLITDYLWVIFLYKWIVQNDYFQILQFEIKVWRGKNHTVQYRVIKTVPFLLIIVIFIPFFLRITFIRFKGLKIAKNLKYHKNNVQRLKLHVVSNQSLSGIRDNWILGICVGILRIVKEYLSQNNYLTITRLRP